MHVHEESWAVNGLPWNQRGTARLVPMMHCGDRGASGRIPTGPKLPIVGPQTDERVFAILGEGCNSTCHTSALFVPEDIGTVAGRTEDLPRCRRRQVHRPDFRGAS